MLPGRIVAVDWRDAIPGSGEPNKKRPGIVVTSRTFFGDNHEFELVVPLSGREELAIAWASTRVEPTHENRCTKTCFALSWNVQSVPHVRLVQTASEVSADILASIRAQIVTCLEG